MTEAVKTLKRARAKIRRQRETRRQVVPCGRCGGAGGSERWRYTGWTCYRCGGNCTEVRSVRVYTDPTLEADDEQLSAIIRQVEADQRYIRWLADAPERERARFEADWDQAIEENAERERIAAQRYLGTVGERLSVEGVIEVAVSVETQWGTSKLVVVNVDGSLVKTFGSGTTLWGHEPGDRVRITGTVKGHDRYMGDKQTVLTRCKIEEIDTLLAKEGA